MIKKLVLLANTLDKIGLYKEASRLDEVTKEMSSEPKLTFDELRVVLEALEVAIADGNPRSMDNKLLISAFEKIKNMPTL